MIKEPMFISPRTFKGYEQYKTDCARASGWNEAMAFIFAEELEADIVLTMTEGQKLMIEGYAPEKIFSLYEFLSSEGDIADPYGGDLDEYNETAQEIYDALVDLAESLVE